jgi:hypothetical protein
VANEKAVLVDKSVIRTYSSESDAVVSWKNQNSPLLKRASIGLTGKASQLLHIFVDDVGLVRSNVLNGILCSNAAFHERRERCKGTALLGQSFSDIFSCQGCDLGRVCTQ